MNNYNDNNSLARNNNNYQLKKYSSDNFAIQRLQDVLELGSQAQVYVHSESIKTNIACVEYKVLKKYYGL
jgi:hypothetical protein